MTMGKFKLALKDFEAVKRVRPRDKDAQMKYDECNKIVRQLAFEKAIAVDSTRKKPSETVDIESMGEQGLCRRGLTFNPKNTLFHFNPKNTMFHFDPN